jgi:hypothetical protein
MPAAGRAGFGQQSIVADSDTMETASADSRVRTLHSGFLTRVHLFDGGFADNPGLRAMLDSDLRYNGINEALKAPGMEKTRKVVIIPVNAATALDVESSRDPDPQERDYLKRLPTSFVLTDEAVDRLIAAGRLVLKSNDEYQRLLSEAAH